MTLNGNFPLVLSCYFIFILIFFFQVLNIGFSSFYNFIQYNLILNYKFLHLYFFQKWKKNTKQVSKKNARCHTRSVKHMLHINISTCNTEKRLWGHWGDYNTHISHCGKSCGKRYSLAETHVHLTAALLVIVILRYISLHHVHKLICICTLSYSLRNNIYDGTDKMQ